MQNAAITLRSLGSAFDDDTRERAISHSISFHHVEGCPYRADLSSAFGAPLLQGATQRSCKNAAPSLGLLPRIVISSAARNLPCTPSFLASFASGFPFSAISHRAIYRYARKIEGFARDDGTRITVCKHFTAGFPLFCCLT